MDLNCQDLKQRVVGFSLVQNCDRIGNGMLRFETPFQYPDGSKIDLFIGNTGELFEDFVLTDLGQTMAYLLDLNLKPWTTKRRTQIVEDICRSLQVLQDGGQLCVKLNSKDDFRLDEGIVRLAQACIRMADLAMTQRLRVGNYFQEEFEEFLSRTELPYEPGIELDGRYGRLVPVDFRVQGRRVGSLVLTLSTANPNAAHPVANEVFRKWHDLEPHKSRHQFVSLYDSTTDALRADDIARLKDVSVVFGFPAEEEQIQAALAA